MLAVDFIWAFEFAIFEGCVEESVMFEERVEFSVFACFFGLVLELFLIGEDALFEFEEVVEKEGGFEAAESGVFFNHGLAVD